MLSCLADGGVPDEDGAAECGLSGTEDAGVTLIRLPSGCSGVCGLDAGSLCGSGACCAGNGVCEGEGFEEFEGESAAPSLDVGPSGVGFESFARRLLRI